MPRRLDRAFPTPGDTFGRWTVVGESYRTNRYCPRLVPCKCVCGAERVVAWSSLKDRKSLSCGCYRRDVMPSKITTHGDTSARLYSIWRGMQHRCHNPNAESYRKYGARGTEVCDEWRSSYESFRAWAHDNSYTDELIIDRIDTFGNYEPTNCRWVTHQQNARNSRANHLLTAFGETKTLVEWTEDERCGLTYAALWTRIKKGWSTENAISTPRISLTKLPNLNLDELRMRLSQGETQNGIARELGITQQTLRQKLRQA